MSVVSMYNGKQSAAFSTLGIPIPDERVLQPHPFTTEEEYWALVLARLEVRYWLQRFRTQRAGILRQASLDGLEKSEVDV